MELLHKFLVWRIKHIRDRNFLFYLGILIGIVSGLAAVILKWSVHFIQNVLTKELPFTYGHFLYVIFPLIGIILTVILAKYVMKVEMGHGITKILYNISKKASVLSRKNMYSRMITSALTVGFGGSVGLEAPIVVTGSAIGSNVGRIVHLNYRKRTLLIGCGAAGAISAIFNSPIAGVIFAIEVLMTDITIAMFIPLLISSVFGSLVSHALLGDEILFSFKLTESFSFGDLPFFIGLGLLAGLVSVYFTRVSYFVEGRIVKIKDPIKRAVFGGIGLGILLLLFRPLYGEGYDIIKQLINNQGDQILTLNSLYSDFYSPIFLILFLLLVLLLKPFASALTIGAGGSGGVFAPSLFIGGVLGFIYAASVNLIMGPNYISLPIYALVGMCGVMSGVLHAPLTAIFLIAEITSGYTLFIPLMLVSAIAFSTANYFEEHSIYTKHLAESGALITNDKDKHVLSIINLKKIIETDLLIILPEASLGELVSLVQRSKRNIFPVVNQNGELEGIVTLDDIREIMFDHDSYNETLVRDLMHSPPANVSSVDNMQSVMHKFETTGAWNLPVIDDGKYVGFLSKSRIFNTYRNKLKHQNVS